MRKSLLHIAGALHGNDVKGIDGNLYGLVNIDGAIHDGQAGLICKGAAQNDAALEGGRYVQNLAQGSLQRLLVLGGVAQGQSALALVPGGPTVDVAVLLLLIPGVTANPVRIGQYVGIAANPGDARGEFVPQLAPLLVHKLRIAHPP